MPRTPRRIKPGRAYHLISRLVDRRWYIETQQERERYLHLLGRALLDSDWKCFAYAVMSNHIHLGAIAGDAPLDSWIRRVHSPFADWLNRTHDRIGGIFVRGPKAFELPPDAVGMVIAYIHNNPVRAPVVGAARDSRWTSHRAYVGLERAPEWLDVEGGLSRSGFSDGEEFDAWVNTMPEERNPPPCEVESSIETPRTACVDSPPACDEIVLAAGEALGIGVERLRSRKRGPHELAARHVAVYCASVLGVTDTEIAKALGLSQQGAWFIRRSCISPDVIVRATPVLERLRGRIPANN